MDGGNNCVELQFFQRDSKPHYQRLFCSDYLHDNRLGRVKRYDVAIRRSDGKLRRKPGFTMTPATGHQVSSVLIDGASVGALTSYTFSGVTANHTISATFTSAATFTITPTAGANGTVSPATPVKVNSGASQTFTITPATGCQVSSVLVDGASVGAVTSYAFSDVTTNHTISASFAAANQPPVADAGPDQTVGKGAKVTLNGSNSTDVGGPGIASYLWTQTVGRG